MAYVYLAMDSVFGWGFGIKWDVCGIRPSFATVVERCSLRNVTFAGIATSEIKPPGKAFTYGGESCRKPA